MTMKENGGPGKGPVAWMAGNSVAANLLMLLLLVGGFIWGLNIKQEIFPEFDLDSISITVAYPGASPEEVEHGIILAVEEAVQGLDGVDEVRSSAGEGVGVVTVDMLTGGDLERLFNDIQKEVDRITSFPVEAEKPQVVLMTQKRPVISIVLFGDQNDRVLREVAEETRDRLIQDPGITQVELSAVRPFEIGIEVPRDILRTYNLTLADIARKIREAALELPAGSIKTEGGEVLIRMKERRNYGDEFARIPVIRTAEGTELLLEDIAVVTDGFEDTDQSATYNGKPAVMLTINRVGDETPITVADAVLRHVEELKETLPPGIEVATLDDNSQVFRDRINLLLNNGYLGLALVFILLGVFLEARLAFWVAMGIPVSFLGTLLFLPLMGVSINMISLFAFIISLGIVVDDAIVVGENIYKYRQKGLSVMKASIEGVREVTRPVTFSVITNIVAFMPLYFVPGFMGKVFRVIPVVVVSAFTISLVECLFILPAHLGHQKRKERSGLPAWLHHQQQGFSHGFTRFVRKVYGPLLNLSLRNRYLTIAASIVLLMLVISYVMSGRIGLILFPRIESDFAQAIAVLPYGSSVKKTKEVQDLLVEAAYEIAAENGGDELILGIFSEVGGSSGKTSGGHVARVRFFLTPPAKRPIDTGTVVKLWRERVGEIAGLQSLVFRADAGGPGSHGTALTVELTHRDMGVLEAASRDLAATLSYFPKVKDIDDGFSPGKEQLDFNILPEGRTLGLTAQGVATQLRNAFYGSEVLRQQRGRNEVKVMVRLPAEERLSEYDLEELTVATPAGMDVPLRDVVTVTRGRAYTSIDRRNGRRIVTVTSDVSPPKDTSQVLDSIKADTLPELVKKYPGLSYGFEGRQAEMAKSMRSLAFGLIAAMLMIYAVLAIPFRSYIQPAIIMVSIPFGIVGAVIGHIIMGYSLSILSMFGIVALAGVVVNDALILIDFANTGRSKGLSHNQAIHAAGIVRFRPIMLTTLTTFFGLSPMILETSRQARFLIPMAISLGFGILFATFITLFLVPSLYMIVEDFKALLPFHKGSYEEAAAESAQAEHGQ